MDKGTKVLVVANKHDPKTNFHTPLLDRDPEIQTSIFDQESIQHLKEEIEKKLEETNQDPHRQSFNLSERPSPQVGENNVKDKKNKEKKCCNL